MKLWMIVILLTYSGPDGKLFKIEKEVSSARYQTLQECLNGIADLKTKSPSDHPNIIYSLQCRKTE